MTTGRPILGRVRLLTEDLSLLAILLVLLTRQALVDKFLLLRGVHRPRGLLRLAVLHALLPVQTSALLRLRRVLAFRCVPLEKKTARPASRGGGERNKVLWGCNVHFYKAVVSAPVTCFGWKPIGFRRNLPVGFLVAHHMARTLFRHNVVRGVDLIPP